jgi:pyruvate dehydrogenase E2 component (dihydrolipoamide acetyltransferase)
MAIPVVMPRQGQSVETCIITQWHKAKGDQVNEGDLLFSYETDKAAFDAEAPGSGTLLDLFFEDGAEVPVLINVAVIGQVGENYDNLIPEGVNKPVNSTGPPQDAQESKQVEVAAEAKSIKQDSSQETSEGARQKSSQDAQPGLSENNEDRLRISPLARRIAKENQLELSGILGSGPQGRIIERDIRTVIAKISQAPAAVQTPAPTQKAVTPTAIQQMPATPVFGQGSHAEGSYKDTSLSNIRKIIATRMHASLQHSAQLTHHISADARKMLAIRKAVKDKAGIQGAADITINDMVCYAVVRALKKHPEANAQFLNNTIRTFYKVHLGIAVDTDRGLMVPALKDADDLNLPGLANKLKALANDCKQGKIDPQLLASEEASFTISNLGAFGIELFTPVLNLPQVGILGVNTITYKAADLGQGTIGFIPMIGLSLTYDHRAIDGAPASRFLKEIKEQIENLSYEI